LPSRPTSSSSIGSQCSVSVMLLLYWCSLVDLAVGTLQADTLSPAIGWSSEIGIGLNRWLEDDC